MPFVFCWVLLVADFLIWYNLTKDRVLEYAFASEQGAFSYKSFLHGTVILEGRGIGSACCLLGAWFSLGKIGAY